MSSNFMDTLSKDERFVFVESLLYLIKTDGRIDNKEREYIKEIVALYGLEAYRKEIFVPASASEILSKIAKVITTRPQALYLLRELLTLANIDDDADERELTFIEQVAETLGIEKNKLLEINQLILNYKIWCHREALVMEEASL